MSWTDEEHTIQDSNDFLCVSPPASSGKSVLSLQADYFTCGMFIDNSVMTNFKHTYISCKEVTFALYEVYSNSKI